MKELMLVYSPVRILGLNSRNIQTIDQRFVCLHNVNLSLWTVKQHP